MKKNFNINIQYLPNKYDNDKRVNKCYYQKYNFVARKGKNVIKYFITKQDEINQILNDFQ